MNRKNKRTEQHHKASKEPNINICTNAEQWGGTSLAVGHFEKSGHSHALV